MCFVGLKFFFDMRATDTARTIDAETAVRLAKRFTCECRLLVNFSKGPTSQGPRCSFRGGHPTHTANIKFWMFATQKQPHLKTMFIAPLLKPVDDAFLSKGLQIACCSQETCAAQNKRPSIKTSSTSSWKPEHN